VPGSGGERGNPQVGTEAEMIIGQIIGGGKLELDLPTLVDTRLLIQANSGGGKSWLLRLIAERAGIQTIVLDNVLRPESTSGPG
jgi:hypothetical protein